MNPDPTDPVIDEIRAVRHRISARHGHDPASLLAYLMKYQEQFRDRLIDEPRGARSDPPEPEPAPPAPVLPRFP